MVITPTVGEKRKSDGKDLQTMNILQIRDRTTQLKKTEKIATAAKL